MATATYFPESSPNLYGQGVGQWLDKMLIQEFHEAGIYLPEERFRHSASDWGNAFAKSMGDWDPGVLTAEQRAAYDLIPEDA